MPSISAAIEAQATAVQLAPVRPERRSLGIYNDSEEILTIGVGFEPTADNFTTRIGPKGDWGKEGTPDSVWGFWAAAQGKARVTEFL